ncbi:hypothetical protein [Nocardia fluminea]|uniref:hypothetical protein n=1 Tax=Nocardia fluminea TaxID=134984 RepID=UPI003D104143
MTEPYDRMKQLRQERSERTEADRTRAQGAAAGLAQRTTERLRDLRDILIAEGIPPVPLYTWKADYGQVLPKLFSRRVSTRNLYTYAEAGSGWCLPSPTEFVKHSVGIWAPIDTDYQSQTGASFLTTRLEVWSVYPTRVDRPTPTGSFARGRAEKVEGLTRGPGFAGAVATDVLGIRFPAGGGVAIGDLDESGLTGWYLDVVESLRQRR